ncbi:MAG: sugar phosphate isomerase/epimerase [Phycisphaeraceae bacterium]|nr:sugar phosphate isomerase/epimerase [Phycisphaeraceae bacterium]
MKTAFSTVACPEWTLDQVFGFAAHLEFDGVELRTLGPASTDLACDPALTDPEKTRKMAARAGLATPCLATSARFDSPIRPPVVGRVIGDVTRSVRAAQREVELADRLGCGFVRVFGFERPQGERAESCIERIADRLRAVADTGRARGVRVVVENGGSFPTAADLMELIDRVGSPMLGAAYSVVVGHAVGEQPRDAIRALGDRLWIVRVKDLAAGRPCALGRGEVPCRAAVDALAETGFGGWVVYEWDRLWIGDLEPAEQALHAADETLHKWIGATRAGGGVVSGRRSFAAV